MRLFTEKLLKLILLIVVSIIAEFSFASQPSTEPNPSDQPFPKIQNSRNYNILLIGELIDWRFSSPNMVYGRDGVSTTLAGAPIVNPGTSFYPDFDYHLGFRTGLGVKFGPSKSFDVVALYTQLHPNPEGSVSSSRFSGLFIPLNWFTGSTTVNTFTSGSLGLNLHFNWVEAQSGYTFLINPYLALRPYIALTSYIIDGDLNANYSFINALGIPQFATTHGDCDSWSIGPKVGLDVIGHITKNIGIFTNVNFTQQSSFVKMSAHEVINTPTKKSVFIAQNGHVTERGNFGLVGLEIGPTLDTWFDNYKYHMQIRATYAASNLASGTNLSFLNNNNQDILMVTEFRGFNVRTTFEF